MSNPKVFKYADDEAIPENDPSVTSDEEDAKEEGSDKGVTSDSSVEASPTTTRGSSSVVGKF